MTTATDASDTELDADLDPSAGTPGRGGFLRSLFRLITAPFRLVAWVARALVALLGVLATIVLLPVKAAVATVRAVLGVAADITFALWRLVGRIVAGVVGLVVFVLRVLNATIGTAIRLIFRILLGTLKLLVRVFTLGKLFGKASAKVSAAASRSAEVTDVDLAA